MVEYLKEKGYEVDDMGTNSPDSVDYPDFGHEVAKRIASGQNEKAILICGTGIGMSMTANRYRGVRAALCNDIYSARMSRLHNDANLLVIGGRIVGPAIAEEVVKTWLETGFEGGRHDRRVKKIDREWLQAVVHEVVSEYPDKIEKIERSDLEKIIRESVDRVLNKEEEEGSASG